jgi:hypothetical protein
MLLLIDNNRLPATYLTTVKQDLRCGDICELREKVRKFGT